MSGKPTRARLRRAAAILGGLLLSLSPAIGLAVGTTAWASPAAPARIAGPSPVSADTIKTALGIGNVPADLVFLVDVSQSMSASRNGLYPDVQQQLPAFLDALAAQEPQDNVTVITFAGAGTAQVIYTGAPTGNIGLPSDANSVGTDFGQAFDLAISQLSKPPAGTKVGGVVMLSDGELWAPSDQEYDGHKQFDAPGWATLRTRAQGLPIEVTGYAVPLTTNQVYIQNQRKALSAVFSAVQTLPHGTTDLSGALGAAGQKVLNSEITDAVSPDSRRGVQVSWSGLPGAGDQPLDLSSAGHRDIQLTITNTMRHVPLYLAGLRLTSPGLPVAVSGHLPSVETLDPGRPVRLPVRLTWTRHSAGCAPWHTSGCSLSGSPQRISGRLVLSATIGSTWTPALRSAFDDLSFSVGGLHGNSISFTAAAATTGVLVFVLILLLILIGLAIALYLRAMLRGALILTSVDERSNELPLAPWPMRRASTMYLIGLDGRISVRGTLLRRGMSIKLQLAGRPTGKAVLEPGGRTMLVGIDIVHARDRVYQAPPAYGRRR